MKICIVGSEEYPAFDSVFSILKEILGSKQVVKLIIKNLNARTTSILKLFKILLQDLALYFKIISHYKKSSINAVLIFQGHYPLTCTALKFLRIKVILYIGGSAFKSSYFNYTDQSFLNRILAYTNILAENICYTFTDLIILPSERMLSQLNLQKHINKVYSAIGIINSGFFDKFKLLNHYKKRKHVVGYVGSLTKSKGILNFLEGIKIIINKLHNESPHFLIIGEGELHSNLQSKISKWNLSDYVSLEGHKSYILLPKYYNKMKLLVLPSYTEGLPSVILEAMACGTPVLATFVGAVPEIIRDCETGFLLKSNDPEYIAEKIIELLNKPDLLEKVSVNANKYVKENFSYRKIREDWQKILIELSFS